MRAVYEERIAEATETQRKIVQGAARLCSSNFGTVCKALWPYKTAENLAAAASCAVRTAAYEISGEREPSIRSFLAVVNKKMFER